MSDPVVSQVRQMKEQDRDLWTNHESRPSLLSEFNQRQGTRHREILRLPKAPKDLLPLNGTLPPLLLRYVPIVTSTRTELIESERDGQSLPNAKELYSGTSHPKQSCTE